MAFTAPQKVSLCKILGVNIEVLQYQLDNNSNSISAEAETAVIAEIARWDAGAGTKFVRVDPNVKNEGTDFDPEDEKRDIRKNIGILLLFPESVWGGSLDSFTLTRG